MKRKRDGSNRDESSELWGVYCSYNGKWVMVAAMKNKEEAMKSAEKLRKNGRDCKVVLVSF